MMTKISLSLSQRRKRKRKRKRKRQRKRKRLRRAHEESAQARRSGHQKQLHTAIGGGEGRERESGAKAVPARRGQACGPTCCLATQADASGRAGKRAGGLHYHCQHANAGQRDGQGQGQGGGRQLYVVRLPVLCPARRQQLFEWTSGRASA